MNVTHRRIYLVPMILVIGSVFALASDREYSHARIVRLSFVEGTVTVQRPASDWANAPVNTPIEEGFQLSTDKSSFAEVQFESGSTARVGELALLKFDQLGRTEAGDLLNTMVLDHGYGTFHVFRDDLGEFEVKTGDAVIKSQGASEFRVDSEQGQARLEVLKGNVEVSSPEITTTLAKEQVLELTPGADTAYKISQGIQGDDWDGWVAERDQQQSAATPPGGSIPGAPAYGWSDLNQYGTWSYFDGYGYGWVPDAMGPWSPYEFGQWSYYPGSGYTWLSYEPWGWLPYHFGGWGFDPLFGWAWFPGEFWGWSPAVVNWYSGPGWVGWVPRPPITGGGLGVGKLPPAKPCPAGASNCVKAVSVATLQHGGPILPQQFLQVKPGEGSPVAAPPVEPTPLASLPGRPVRLSPAQEAVINGTPVNSGRFLARVSPASHQWAERAPRSVVPSPPAEVRHTEAASFWSRGGSGSSSISGSHGFSASRGSSGSLSGGHESGGFHGGGDFGHVGGGGGISASAGGGGHSGGAGGGGGGHH